jgi:hypothetical protein
MEHIRHAVSRMQQNVLPQQQEQHSASRAPADSGDVVFWHSAEYSGWLWKQGEHIRTWRKRWFVLKRGKLAWFKDANVTSESSPRGIVELRRCLSVRGASDVLNSPCAFEVATQQRSMFFYAPNPEERGHWINALGKVRTSRLSYSLCLSTHPFTTLQLSITYLQSLVMSSASFF